MVKSGTSVAVDTTMAITLAEDPRSMEFNALFSNTGIVLYARTYSKAPSRPPEK
jgi:hypothetical protein